MRPIGKKKEKKMTKTNDIKSKVMRLMRPMRPMRLIGLMGPIGLVGLMALMVSCSDDAPEQRGELQKVELTPYYNLYNSINEQGTRAEGDPIFTYSGTYLGIDFNHKFHNYSYLYPSPVEYPVINVWFIEENGNQHQGTFEYKGPKDGKDLWESHATTISGKNYYVYGFMPLNAVSDGTASIAMLDGKTSYEDGAKLTLPGLAAVSNKDICVVVGVGTTTDDIQNTTDNPAWGRLGSFSYTGKDKGSNKIYLLLDHIYTNINLEYRVADKYAALRTIKLKQVTMQTSNAEKVTLTIPFNKITDSYRPPVGTITTTLDGNECSAEIFGSTEGVAIPAVSTGNWLSVPGYFTPAISGMFTITSYYDVYDRKGNLVRANQSATNQVKLTESGSLEKGVSYKVNFTVQPTYLYQLSDPDLDNPTIKVGS